MVEQFPLKHFFSSQEKNHQMPQIHSSPLTPQKILLNQEEEQQQDGNDGKALKKASPCWDQKELYALNQEILTELEKMIDSRKFNIIFKDNIKLTNITEDSIFFKATSGGIKKTIETQYSLDFSHSIYQILGKKYKITILTEKGGEPRFTLDLDKNQNGPQNCVLSPTLQKKKNLSFDPQKTFENFVAGSSNNLAFSVAWSISQNPGKEGKYPCLYLYGGSGLGKTHLLHAIANEIAKNHPKKNVYLTSGRNFFKEVAQSAKEKKLSEFQKKYSENTDVLIIDDVYELKNKTHSQKEFFHIFNELHSKGKQLIFSSDKSPEEIKEGIEEKVVSRFSWGLVIEIQPSDLETRTLILKQKALSMDLFVPNDVIHLIASSIKNIRELEGTLLKLSASVAIMDTEIDLEMVRETLKLTAPKENPSLNREKISKAVCQYYKISLAELHSKSRTKSLVQARHITWYLSRQFLNLTLKEIALYYGRDHSSVLYGINKVAEQMKTTLSLKKEIIDIEHYLK